jgi:hypothetical protein
MMTIRAGYNYAFDAPPQSPFPLSAGLGFRYRNLSLDYAYTSQEYFSSTHTFSVGISFGSGSNPLDTRSRRDGGAVTPEPLSSGQPAAPSAATPTAAPEKIAPRPADGPKFLITGGTHARRESAESEVRALKLLKIDATVEAVGNQYRVVIEKLDSRAKAETALAKYESRGHRFRLLTQAP